MVRGRALEQLPPRCRQSCSAARRLSPTLLWSASRTAQSIPCDDGLGGSRLIESLDYQDAESPLHIQYSVGDNLCGELVPETMSC
jgi:hypothetical protein